MVYFVSSVINWIYLKQIVLLFMCVCVNYDICAIDALQCLVVEQFLMQAMDQGILKGGVSLYC
jgi:hypothetical protein